MRCCAYGAFNDAHPERGLENHMTVSLPDSAWCSDACFVAHHKEMYPDEEPCSECFGLYAHYDVLCAEHKSVRAR